jgi:uncharacterized membrane protein
MLASGASKRVRWGIHVTRPTSSSSHLVKRTAILLATVGVVSALLRYALPHDLHVVVATPLYGSFAPEHFSVLEAHPGVEALHRVGGALYMILGVMQFMPKLRARRPALHRWSGRIFLTLSVTAALSGAFMSLAFPFERGEGPPSVIFAAVMVLSAVQAYLHIRRGDVVGHREWVTRCFAVGLGIGTIRLIAVVVLNLTHLVTRQIITPSFWAGWVVTLLGAEVWIRAQRRAAAPSSTLLGGRPGEHAGLVEGQQKLSYHPPPLGE